MQRLADPFPDYLEELERTATTLPLFVKVPRKASRGLVSGVVGRDLPGTWLRRAVFSGFRWIRPGFRLDRVL